MRAAHRGRPGFLKALDDAAKNGIQVCRIHGDMNQTNVLRHGEEIWLLDWEQSQPDGPALTDTICVAVDDLSLSHPGDAAGNLRKFRQAFLDERDESTRAQVILALAYLGAAKFPPALAMIEAWFPQGGDPTPV